MMPQSSPNMSLTIIDGLDICGAGRLMKMGTSLATNASLHKNHRLIISQYK
uniref:Uncharacterized protein n=1 Tax=Arundo donax TaxID=35708 RepID=A0A0A9CTI1_ARUDO